MEAFHSTNVQNIQPIGYGALPVFTLPRINNVAFSRHTKQELDQVITPRSGREMNHLSYRKGLEPNQNDNIHSARVENQKGHEPSISYFQGGEKIGNGYRLVKSFRANHRSSHAESTFKQHEFKNQNRLSTFLNNMERGTNIKKFRVVSQSPEFDLFKVTPTSLDAGSNNLLEMSVKKGDVNNTTAGITAQKNASASYKNLRTDIQSSTNNVLIVFNKNKPQTKPKIDIRDHIIRAEPSESLLILPPITSDQSVNITKVHSAEPYENADNSLRIASYRSGGAQSPLLKLNDRSAMSPRLHPELKKEPVKVKANPFNLKSIKIKKSAFDEEPFNFLTQQMIRKGEFSPVHPSRQQTLQQEDPIDSIDSFSQRVTLTEPTESYQIVNQRLSFLNKAHKRAPTGPTNNDKHNKRGLESFVSDSDDTDLRDYLDVQFNRIKDQP